MQNASAMTTDFRAGEREKEIEGDWKETTWGAKRRERMCSTRLVSEPIVLTENILSN